MYKIVLSKLAMLIQIPLREIVQETYLVGQFVYYKNSLLLSNSSKKEATKHGVEFFFDNIHSNSDQPKNSVKKFVDCNFYIYYNSKIANTEIDFAI